MGHLFHDCRQYFFDMIENPIMTGAFNIVEIAAGEEMGKPERCGHRDIAIKRSLPHGHWRAHRGKRDIPGLAENPHFVNGAPYARPQAFGNAIEQVLTDFWPVQNPAVGGAGPVLDKAVGCIRGVQEKQPAD